MQRIDAIVSRIAHTLGGRAGGRSRERDAMTHISDVDGDRAQAEPEQEMSFAPANLEVFEEQAVRAEIEGARDKDLSGHILKLIRYKILFVKRKYEVAFPEIEELIADSLTDTGYTAWKIAQFIQGLDHIAVPAAWGGGKDKKVKPAYPKGARYKDGRWVIHELDEDDKKYLRVYFEVLERYKREKFNHKKRQIKVLKEISKRI
jgi:hypothetical protein